MKRFIGLCFILVSTNISAQFTHDVNIDYAIIEAKSKTYTGVNGNNSGTRLDIQDIDAILGYRKKFSKTGYAFIKANVGNYIKGALANQSVNSPETFIVGFHGKKGTISFGKQRTPSMDIHPKYFFKDHYGDTKFTTYNIGSMGNGGQDIWDNSIKYVSSEFLGKFNFSLMFSPNEALVYNSTNVSSAQSSSLSNNYQVGVSYGKKDKGVYAGASIGDGYKDSDKITYQDARVVFQYTTKSNTIYALMYDTALDRNPRNDIVTTSTAKNSEGRAVTFFLGKNSKKYFTKLKCTQVTPVNRAVFTSSDMACAVGVDFKIKKSNNVIYLEYYDMNNNGDVSDQSNTTAGDIGYNLPDSKAKFQAYALGFKYYF